MMVGKFLRGKIFRKDTETKDLVHVERLGKAFSQISSAINTHKELKTILEAAVRGVLNCLKAQRSTIFSGTRKATGSNPTLPLLRIVQTSRCVRVRKKRLHKKPSSRTSHSCCENWGDFSEFSKTKRTEQKISSRMSVPFSSGDKTVGVLSAVVVNGHSFSLQSLQFFSILVNHVSIALEMARMYEDLRKAQQVQKAYHLHQTESFKGNQCRFPCGRSQATGSRSAP